MRKIFLILVFFTLFTETFSQQLIIKLDEGFESITFPPTGWKRINVMGANVWQRLTAPLPSVIMQPPVQGDAVARIDYQYDGGEDWLITKKINSIESGDSLVFYLIKQSALGPFPPDSLLIKVSTTDSLKSSFTNLLLNINIAGIPIGIQVWYRITLPLTQFSGENIYIAFQHKDVNGHGCAIDSVVVFNPNSIGISKNGNTLPEKPFLHQNYPNPFNPATNIKFQIAKSSFVRLSIYDILGREVAVLVNEKLKAGIYKFRFSVDNFKNSYFSSGIYFYRIKLEDYSAVKSMILIK